MLIETYPEFRPLYNDLYDLCLNIERVMNMFSKELSQLDNNTVQFMIDQMQDELDAPKAKLDEQKTLSSPHCKSRFKKNNFKMANRFINRFPTLLFTNNKRNIREFPRMSLLFSVCLFT